MFLAKYGIDGKREVDSSDIRKILKDFEKKGYFPTRKCLPKKLTPFFGFGTESLFVYPSFGDSFFYLVLKLSFDGRR